MKPLFSIDSSVWLLYLLIVVVGTSPVWGVTYFINQDGSAHVQSAYLIGEILRGNPIISETYILNSICVPNSSVHFVLVPILQVFSAFTATKIVVCGLFAGFVGSIGWLRFATVGADGLKTSLLIGAAVGFNWLWMVGLYNFIFSVIVLAFTLGLYWNWRQRMNTSRTVILSLLFVVAYLSHLIGFAVLVGSVILLAIRLSPPLRYRALAILAACMLPVVPLAICYRNMLGDDHSPARPVWRSLADPYSITNWLTQIRSADPFVLISHSAFPFIDARHAWFGLLAPSLWMIVAIAILLGVRLRPRLVSKYLSNSYFPFAVLLLISAVLAMFGPDDFGLSRGGILRERIVICGLIFVIPLFRTGGSRFFELSAQVVLSLVILFQIAAVWDYSIRANRSAAEFVAAKPVMNDLRSVAAVTVYAEHPRFHSSPEAMLNLYNSVGNNMIAWDNYEYGHFLFPVRTRNKVDKDFTEHLAMSNVLFADDPPPLFAERLAALDLALATDGGRLDAILVWGKNDDVNAVVMRYFGPKPVYESENLRLFRGKR